MDFALWKAAKPGEPAWDSPWGDGPAGLAHRVLGDVARPARRGVRPPRRRRRPRVPAPRERAGPGRGRRASRSPRHWIHTGMVTIGGEKMAKSLGNFTTVEEALDEHERRGIPARGAADALPARRRPRRHGARRGRRRRRAARRAVPTGGDAGRRRRRRRWTPRHVDRFRAAMDDDFDTRRAGRRVRGRVATPTARSTTATSPTRRRWSRRSRELARRARPRHGRRRRRRAATPRSTPWCASATTRAPRATSPAPTRSATSSPHAASSSRTRPSGTIWHR